MLIKNHQPALIPLFLLIQVFSLSLLIKKVRKEEEGCLVDIMAQGVGTFSGEVLTRAGALFRGNTLVALQTNPLLFSFQVDRRKIEEMKLAENFVFTMPNSDASYMTVEATLMNESRDIIFQTGEMDLELSTVSSFLISA